MHARDVIAQYLADKASGHDVLRAACEHTWTVETVFGAGEFHIREAMFPEGRWVSLYSSPERCKAEFTTTVEGAWYFRGLGSQIYGINLDLDTPEAIHYRGAEHMQLLRRWGSAVHIERILAERAGPEVYDQTGLFRTFDGWSIAVALGTEKMVLAPDAAGRKLAAVCTAPDNLAAFMNGHAAKLGVPVGTMALTSKALFDRLAQMDIDGIVFNPLGPTPAKAVQRAFAEAILNSFARP